ncbi:MAG: hypothetical protein Q9174_000615 [Haloplaca sp. 1 TL-2023]
MAGNTNWDNNANGSFDPADIERAIRASLASHGEESLNQELSSGRAADQRKWSMQPHTDWMAYKHQKELLDEAYPEPSNKSKLNQNQDEIPADLKKLWEDPIDKAKALADDSESEDSNVDHQPEQGQATETQGPYRSTLDDRIEEMQSTATPKLFLAGERGGDTWVFLDPPARQPEQTEYTYQLFRDRCQKPVTMRSATLRAVCSPFFDNLLGPSSQRRTIRRRKLYGLLPGHIKYVIDLTPPGEGDEAAWLMTELCCVEGLRMWSESQARWAVSRTLCGGQDDFIPDSAVPPELSPIRHRSSIEKVLAALSGIDPGLDSAVKVYTTATVARFFKIVHSPLTDYIIRWIRATPNSVFIEALPEIALKIGDGLQNYDLIRDAFAVLVGEAALGSMRSQPSADFSIFCRKKYHLPESYQTRIQYASRSLADRVTRTFESLIELGMQWMEVLPEIQKLLGVKCEAMKPFASETIRMLKAFVRGALLSVLHCRLNDAPQPAMGSAGGDDLYPRVNQADLWNQLTLAERPLTSTLWRAIRDLWSADDFDGASNLKTWPRRNDNDGWVNQSVVRQWAPVLDRSSKELLVEKHNVVDIPHQYLVDLATRCRKGTRSPSDEPQTISSLDWAQGYALEAQKTPRLVWNPHTPSPGYRISYDEEEADTNGAGTDPFAYEKPEYSTYPPLGENGIDFRIDCFYREVQVYFKHICQKMMEPADVARNDPMYPVLTPTLLSLDESEWKYLPLYAGGFDDGTGGVFDDDVPSAETGFSTAGPSIHTGSGSSAASSEYDMVERQDVDSTRHTSTVVNDGFSDQLDRGKVYDEDDDGLWDQVARFKGKSNTKSAATTTSHVDNSTLAPESTFGTGDDDEGFVLPLRPRDEMQGLVDSTRNTRIEEDETRRRDVDDDYDDIFIENDDSDDDDDDDDTATEKGDDADGKIDDDDEDMVIL